MVNYKLSITNYALRIVGCESKAEIQGGASPKKPPFRKRGVGGIYTYTYTYAYAPALRDRGFDAETQRRRGTQSERWGRGVAGDAAWWLAARWEIPPTPLLRKGGFFGGLRQRPGACHIPALAGRPAALPHPTLSRWERAFRWAADWVSWYGPGFVMRGRGARPCVPTLYGGQRYITPHNHIVIPAKAGIHTPAYCHAGANRGSGFRPAPNDGGMRPPHS